MLTLPTRHWLRANSVSRMLDCEMEWNEKKDDYVTGVKGYQGITWISGEGECKFYISDIYINNNKQVVFNDPHKLTNFQLSVWISITVQINITTSLTNLIPVTKSSVNLLIQYSCNWNLFCLQPHYSLFLLSAKTRNIPNYANGYIPLNLFALSSTHINFLSHVNEQWSTNFLIYYHVQKETK